MTFKELWSKLSGWLQGQRASELQDYQPQINDEGLISAEAESADSAVNRKGTTGNQVIVKTIQPSSKQESLEKLQAGFDKLVEKLHAINQHLERQVVQNEDLMNRINQLPKLLESFPAVVENQKHLTEQLIEQLKAASVKDQQFVDAVEKIPKETAKQTDALVNIDHQLAAAADTDVQMGESFNKFNETMDKLNQTAIGQTDAICQMSKTFAASDRYLKYIMSRQNKRFMWIFVIAVSACVLVSLILTGIIIYLRR
jgi:chromosome segregation ATPase